MAVIGSIEVNVLARLDKFTRDMKKSEQTVKRFATTAEKNVKRVTNTFRMLSGIIIGGGLIRGVTQLTKQIDNLAKTSDKLGVPIQQLAGLQHAGEQTGVAVNTMNMALQRMTRRVSEAASGTGEAQGALKELRLDAEKLNQMSPDKQFQAIAKAMGGVANQQDKIRLAFKLFDSEGVSVINTLNLGVEGLEKMNAEAKKLGIAPTREEARRMEQFNDTLDRLSKTFRGGATGFLVDAGPDLISATEVLSDWMKWTGKRAATNRDTFSRFFGGVVSTEAIQRGQAHSDRALMDARAAAVDPFALGFATRGEGFRGARGIAQARENREAAARRRLEQQMQATRIEELSRSSDPFAMQTREISVQQNREAFGRISGRLGNIGSGIAGDFSAGLMSVVKKLQFHNTPLGHLGTLTGIPIEGFIKGKKGKRREEEERDTPMLSAVRANTVEGHRALRQNLAGEGIEKQQLSELRGIRRAVEKGSDVKEVGID